MTDRELLERAAKAAGIKLGNWHDVPGYGTGFASDASKLLWNPLNDDGNALWLAVRLNLSIKFDVESDGAFVSVGSDFGDEDEGCWSNEYLLKDSGAATRRAIVRAAAEMAP
jgi:hypothetical protein